MTFVSRNLQRTVLIMHCKFEPVSPGDTTMFSGALTDRPPGMVSASVTVQLTLPNTLAASVKVRRPATLITGLTAKNPLGAELQLTLNASSSDSPGPDDTFVAHTAEYAPESSMTSTVPPAVNDGGSFTAMQEDSTYSFSGWCVERFHAASFC
jgi:hypothetical protein